MRVGLVALLGISDRVFSLLAVDRVGVLVPPSGAILRGAFRDVVSLVLLGCDLGEMSSLRDKLHPNTYLGCGVTDLLAVGQ